jgi:hypothetical protein
MFVAFFEYDGGSRFFGYAALLKVTGFSRNVNKALHDLEMMVSGPAPTLDHRRPFHGPFIQGFAHRKVDFGPDGHLKTLDHFPESVLVEFRAPNAANIQMPFLLFDRQDGTFQLALPRLSDAVLYAERRHNIVSKIRPGDRSAADQTAWSLFRKPFREH